MTKNELRLRYSEIRRKIPNTSEKTQKIGELLFSFEPFINADTVLVYVSNESEINTYNIISHCFENNKRVAVPRCKDKDGNMDFYLIDSFDCLVEGTFGLMEPDTDKCKKLTDFRNSLIIVPALCFDRAGYRIGYGKGYYDRFLKNYTLISLGLCYNMLIADKIPFESYDKRVDYIITETGIINTDNGGKNG